MARWEADGLVDELLPEELDWQLWVRRYPKLVLSLAAFAGYLLGSSRGGEIVDAATARAADSLSESVNQLIDSGR